MFTLAGEAGLIILAGIVLGIRRLYCLYMENITQFQSKVRKLSGRLCRLEAIIVVCQMIECISKSRDREHYIFLSSGYKQTDAENMCDRRRHLCLTNGIHILSGCLLSDGRERYNAPYPGNLKYNYKSTNYN